MRCPRSICIFLLVASQPLPSWAEDTAPYVAVVQIDDAPVRSGPSPEFYETDRLSLGARVDVYRHDGDGWCAIRPPEQSFSWVPARNIERTDNPSIGRVVNPPVKTRVGSRFNDIHDVEYISLRKDELVQLLDTAQLVDPVDNQEIDWFKIAPPSGEFRWIHVSQLQRVDEPIETTINSWAQTAVPPGQVAEPDVESKARVATTEQAVGSGAIQTFPLASRPTPVADEAPAEAFADVSDTHTVAAAFTEPVSPAPSAATQPVSLPKGVKDVEWRAVVQSPGELLTSPEPIAFEQRLGTLNLMLSKTVLGAVTEWDLDLIVEQTKLLKEQASTQEQRLAAQSLQSKAIEFQDLQIRKLELAKQTQQDETIETIEPNPLPIFAADAAVPPVPEMPRLPNSNARKADVTPEDDTQEDLRRNESVDNSIFDVTGQLVAVRTSRSDMPRFALTDSRGQIIRFVAASGDIDLARFANQHVGIIGEEGYLRKLKKPLVAARKIVSLK